MKHHIDTTALFRLSILGPLASRERFESGELKLLLSQLSQQTYMIPGGEAVQFGEKTIERWYYRWKKCGIEGLAPVQRSDKHSCQLDKATQEAIIQCKKDNPARSINTLIRCLELEGKVQKESLSRATVHRLLKRHDLSKRTFSGDKIERRAFESAYAGDLWQGDVMHGPIIQTEEGRRKVYLVSIIDDASRLICHSAFYLNETVVSVEAVLKDALLKRGLPKKLLVDNGAAYRSEALQQVCARLKIRLIYSRPYEPQSKAKLERWHLTVRQQFLTEIDFCAIHSLADLNARWWVWLERHYHQTPHSALIDALTQKHQTPLERFQQDLTRIQPLGQLAATLDDYFYHRVKRKIKKDGTLSFEGKLFEVPFAYAEQSVYLVVDLATNTPHAIESLSYEPLGPVTPLDKKANNARIRHRPPAIEGASTAQTSLVETLFKKTTQQLSNIF